MSNSEQKKQTVCRWVKASERMPEKEKIVCMKVNGRCCSGKFDGIDLWLDFDQHAKIAEDWEYKNIFWLLEEEKEQEERMFTMHWQFFIDELQAGTDRILRDKGASNKIIYDTINGVCENLKESFKIERIK